MKPRKVSGKMKVIKIIRNEDHLNHIVFKEHCFHCDKEFLSPTEINAYRDANCFPLTEEFYNGQYLGDAYRFVCDDCKDTEMDWFNTLRIKEFKKFMESSGKD